jgi:release factor glutamine methyltransferase
VETSIHSTADALRFGKQRLAKTGTETPGLDAEVLLRHVLGLNRTALFARLPEAMDPVAIAAYRRFLDDRAGGIPVAYLTGEREFMGITFEVSPDVLVPRPETEILVEWALRWLRDRTAATVVDVGTGSGAIALSLATLLGQEAPTTIVAIDVSDPALAIAQQNRDRLGLQDRVALIRGSMLDPIASPVDLVLANLPYLRPEQIAENPQLATEPRLALDGGTDGLQLIRRLLLAAPPLLKPGGAIGLEIDPAQRDTVVRLAAQVFPGATITVLPDLAGLDRHVTIQT